MSIRLKRTAARSRWLLVVVMDMAIIAGSLLLFSYMRGFSEWLTWRSLTICGLTLMLSTLVFMTVFGANKSLWRYADSTEYLRLIASYCCGFIVTLIAFQIGIMHSGFSRLFILAVQSFALLFSILVRVLNDFLRKSRDREARKAPEKDRLRHLAIVGAGSAGVMLLDELRRNKRSPYKVYCFFDDDETKVGQYIHGIQVKGVIDDLTSALTNSPVTDIAIAIPSLELSRRREVVDMCEKLDCRVKIVPDTMLAMDRSGSLSASMRDVRIEDLLSRTTTTFHDHELDGFIKGKTVMVTGGGGSIGSELCRQIAAAGVGRIVIFDICENDTYILYRELKRSYPEEPEICVEVGSIVDKKHVFDLFEKYRPDVVFHAAAHKHVPLMEDCPYEAIRNNIFGTYNLLLAAKEYSCPKFVFISSDKAVNPTNIMGATKRYCELMVRAMTCEPDCETDYVSVRFGNVLGSHGSVLPLFQLQLEHGGPITVTDRRVTRYFMTIPEAASLVIRAGSMAKRSEVFILDMGEPVRILELAERFVRLSGYEPYTEIPIVETGLRPGEKLFEELLINEKEHVRTSDAKIFVERNSEFMSMETIKAGLAELWRVTERNDDEEIIAALRSLVPTYVTPEEFNESVSEQLRMYEEKELAGTEV